ncbi:HEPN domain-containing protein [Streptomyces longwoodensis]|uniref:HEPN domain-containing protein n=1 Tax=Streptomyces longwoodensis TaxID=68231 RepID=UPI00384DAB2E
MSQTSLDTSYPGSFWSALDPSRKVPGRLVLDGRWPRIILSSPLTPSLEVKETVRNPDGSSTQKLGVPLRNDPLTIHGEVIGAKARKVTIFAANTIRHRGEGIFSLLTGRERLEEQTLEGDWCLLGAHEDENFEIETCSFRFQNIDEWTSRGEFSLEVAPDGSRGAIAYEKPGDVSARIPGSSRVIIFATTRLVRPPSKMNGLGFSYRTHFRFERLPAITMSDLLNQYIGPVVQLVTLCTGGDAAPTSIEVKSSSGDRWCIVHHPVLKDAYELNALLNPLLSMYDLGIHGIARWISRHAKISPIPGLVANIVSLSQSRDIENQVLELATSFEGLHRRLYPNVQRISKSKADELRRAARRSVPVEFQAIVNEALFHLHDPTYHERLAYLLGEVGSVAPNIVGNRESWLKQVKNARNGFAHQLPNVKMGSIEALDALGQSLRWSLTFLLLRQTGIDDTLLSQRIQDHRPYEDFLLYAKQVNPEVWPSAANE